MRRPALSHRRLALVVTALAVVLAAGIANASVWATEDERLSVSIAVKGTGLGARYSSAAMGLGADRAVYLGTVRGRFMLEAKPYEWVNAEVALEPRGVVESASLVLRGGTLTGAFMDSYRWAKFNRGYGVSSRTSSTRIIWLGDVDRAVAQFHLTKTEITVGRQAVGWGRGTIFSAVDIFNAFSPLEVDREWRRGIDAVRAEVRLTDTFSSDVVAAFGRTIDESAFIGRVRGYVGRVDAEIMAGRRREDAMIAATMSAAVGDAEVHGEAAVFKTPEDHPGGRLIKESDMVASTVVGGSYNFDIGSGLPIWVEYYYTGFGLRRAKGNISYSNRLLRGDAQTLGRHAVGFSASYEITDAWQTNLIVIGSPVDGSGAISPRVTYDWLDNVTVIASIQAPFGARPDGTGLRSEYGAEPLSAFFQVSVYF